MSGQAFVHAGGPTEDALYDYLAGRLHPDAEPWIADHVNAVDFEQASQPLAEQRVVVGDQNAHGTD